MIYNVILTIHQLQTISNKKPSRESGRAKSVDKILKPERIKSLIEFVNYQS